MPLRIAYISDRPFPSFWTDTQQVMKNAEGLALAGADVTLLVSRPFRTLFTSRRVRHARLREHYRVSEAMRLVDLLTVPHSALRVEKWPHAVAADVRAALRGFDVIYSRNLFPAWLAARMGLCVVYENHRRPEPSGPKRRALEGLVSRRELLGVVTNSEFVRSSFLEVGIEADRVLACKLGHDPREFEPRMTRAEARDRLGLDPDRPIVAYAGHIDSSKGVDALLELARLLPAVEVLVLGGTERQSSALGERARGRGLGNVITRKSVPPAEVPPYLLAADVLVNPPSSVLLAHPHTITPIKLYNYLAAGRPIIAGDTPDIAELLTHDVDALLCRPDDLEAAASTIDRVLADRALAERLSRAALETALTLTWEGRGKRILGFIEALLRGG